jgi:putative FmdB family regulatory protein
MPTYEYQCEKCHKSFDCQQSMKDAPFKTCPREFCRMKTWGKGKVVRQLGTGAGLIFKGSGFYVTDYRSEGYKAAAKSESGAAKSESSGSETKSTEAKKTDAKPAAAEKSKPASKKKGD